MPSPTDNNASGPVVPMPTRSFPESTYRVSVSTVRSPVTARLVKVPTEVINGWAALVTVAAVPLALPVKAPTKSVEVTLVNPEIVASRLSVTSPEAPPPLRFVPAVTPVMSPVVGAAHEGTPDARVRTSVSEPFASFANVVVVSA